MCQNLFRGGLPGGCLGSKREKRCQLPKSKLAGSQILEKLGSKRGEEVPVAQKQARGKPIQASKKLINCLTDTEKCVMVITVSIFMT